jgi:hypothetical protein
MTINENAPRPRPDFVPPDPAAAKEFHFAFNVRNDIPVPRDLLRKARSLARYRRPPRLDDPRGASLVWALMLASRGEWRNNGQRWKLYRQSDKVIRQLLRCGRTHVGEVTECDLIAVVDQCYAESLSTNAIIFRLDCLATLGVNGGAKIHRRAGVRMHHGGLRA